MAHHEYYMTLNNSLHILILLHIRATCGRYLDVDADSEDYTTSSPEDKVENKEDYSDELPATHL